MEKSLKVEKSQDDLGAGRKWIVLILASIGSSIIYYVPYLSGIFYDPVIQALNITNTQLGLLFSAYAISAMICYIPSGIVADKIRMRTLSGVGFISTALLVLGFALLPPFEICLVIYAGLGVTTILIWWGVRFKLVRLIYKEEEYPKRIGISYGLYGAAGLVFGLLAAGIVGLVANNMGLAFSYVLLVNGLVLLVLGVLSFIFIPKFKEEIKSESALDLSGFVSALKNPVVWLAALSVFFVYWFSQGVAYTTPYLTAVLGASLIMTTVVATIRQYGVGVLSAPIFGFIADKFKPSKVVAIGSIAFAVCALALRFLPTTAAIVIIAAVLVIVLGFLGTGTFGIVSGQLTEGRVPVHYFGAATGLLSIIGYLPDVFFRTWFGSIMDAGTDAAGVVAASAFQQIFVILIIVAILAAATSFALFFYVTKRNARLAAKEISLATEATNLAAEATI